VNPDLIGSESFAGSGSEPSIMEPDSSYCGKFLFQKLTCGNPLQLAHQTVRQYGARTDTNDREIEIHTAGSGSGPVSK
jgi:hypothetical protein